MLSIITPNLNDGIFLEENILSIIKLSIPFEHIVVDGGSTDSTMEILARYPHVKVINQKEKNGMFGAIDEGFKVSNGNMITWVNSDDRIVVEGYEKMYNLATQKDLDLVYSDGIYDFIHESKKKLARGVPLGRYFFLNGIFPTMQPAILFSKKIYNQVGGMDYKNFKVCGDFDLFVKFAKDNSAKIAYSKGVSAIFIKRGDSLGDLNVEGYTKEVITNNLPIPNFLHRVLYFFVRKYVNLF